ncbi:ASCH domain-containing protein [Companilactobacillus halodurans]|uniref:ASCH domain-containing protein n=1 Tax=Companilactobacillus halodurans TaxID=2584183 RepID=A0A5P0ZML6_9LACO|nr:ASCH domain-containing protein [Companilactobacillus halodurans]MQS75081.1 ASCH domain-containing protein [Companilactobacillus halodurans]MQS96850.1 ASCH domain-containing protein [Companilactobacillus halodurans]
MDKEKIHDYWFNFLQDKNSLYYPLGDISSFGAEPDKLANLVCDGVKTATTSSYDLYEPNEYLPQVGDYNIILDGQENPICITKTVVTEVVPFKYVSAEHAYHEGEGDKTLTYWRKVHEDFFRKEYQESGKEFNDEIPCLCEVFKRIY